MLLFTLLACFEDTELRAEVETLRVTVMEQQALIDQQLQQQESLITKYTELEARLNNLSGGLTMAELVLRIEDNGAAIDGLQYSQNNAETRIADIEDTYVSVADLDLYASKAWVTQQEYASAGDVANNAAYIASQGTLISDNSGQISILESQISTLASDYVSSSTLVAYAEKTWVEAQGYATEAYVQVQPFAQQSDLETNVTAIEALGDRIETLESTQLVSDDLAGYATELWVTQQDFASPELESLSNYLSVDETNHTIKLAGANVYIQSGSGYTDDDFVNTASLTGLGNLIIGYDETASGDEKTGSHNLIIGSLHTYTSYGTVVAGYDNATLGAYTATTGGTGNQSLASYSSISGGAQNLAEGTAASISGGYNNSTTGDYSSIGGGESGTASGNYSSITAGLSGTASGSYASISGGSGGAASGDYSSISAGLSGTASGLYSSIVAGSGNIASGDYSAVSGGSNSTSEGAYSSISGGLSHSSIGDYSSITGGQSNQTTADYASVAGGMYNKASGVNATISGGESGVASGSASSISGGRYNTASASYTML
ncbi:MAG: hypothetical protein VX278_06045, partial [Myxococcota bacterium]|nr:hypothetical protein [Myxococcota bacterium]